MATNQSYAYNLPLTSFATSWYDNLPGDPIRFLAPNAQAPGIRGEYKRYNRADAFSITDIGRAMYSKVKTINLEGEDVPYTLQTDGLGIGIDAREVMGVDASFATKLRQQKTAKLVGTFMRSYIRKNLDRINAQVPVVSSYHGIDNIGKWSDDSVDARAQLKALCKRFALVNGVYPNRLLASESALDVLGANQAVKDAIKFVSTDELTDDLLRELLGYKKANRPLEVMSEIMPYNTGHSGDETEADNVDMLGSDLYLFYASEDPSIFDLSGAKTLTVGDDNIIDRVETKYDDDRDTEWIRVKTTSLTVVTAPSCILRISVS